MDIVVQARLSVLDRAECRIVHPPLPPSPSNNRGRATAL